MARAKATKTAEIQPFSYHPVNAAANFVFAWAGFPNNPFGATEEEKYGAALDSLLDVLPTLSTDRNEYQDPSCYTDELGRLVTFPNRAGLRESLLPEIAKADLDGIINGPETLELCELIGRFLPTWEGE